MGTIARGAKAGGGTNLNSGQTCDPAEVNTDFNTLYTEVNGELDDGNIKTGELPGAKSLRFTEMTAPASPASDDALLYSVNRDVTTTLEYKDSAGLVVSLGRVGCRVYNTANQSIPDATSTVVTFDTERFDRGGLHSTVSNTGRITFPFACTAIVGGTISFAANGTGNRALDILLNGATAIANVSYANVGAGINSIVGITTLYSFAANDYVELRAFQGSGGALNSLASLNSTPEFWAYVLGG